MTPGRYTAPARETMQGKGIVTNLQKLTDGGSAQWAGSWSRL